MVEFPFEPSKVWALTKRDMYNWTTYRSTVFTAIMTSLVGIASWGLNATFRNVAVPAYNTDYVSFLISGILVANLILPLGQGIQQRFNPQTLETILMSGLKTPTLVLGSVAWTYLLSVVFFIPQLLIGIFVFGATFNMNFVSLILAVAISSGVVFSLAIITTGIRLVTKVSDPVTWGLSVASQIFSGMTFPVSHLNDFLPGLSNVSWILPQTWIYHIVRLATLSDASVLQPSVALSFLITFLFVLVLLPFSFYVFRWGLRRAKTEGTLGWY
jgi:hypothetical protein